MTVAAALGGFFAAHGPLRDGYRSRRFRVRVGPLTLGFPNPGKLPLHDLHHVALGVAPSFWGEVEVSAFELRSGSPSALITLLCVGALVLGGLVAPRRVLGWWRRYAGCRNLYREPYEPLLALELDELRRRMRLPWEQNATTSS
jgi:hypothetical protein